MKRFNLLAFSFSFILGINAQTRYIDEIFTDVNVMSDIVYSNNIEILSGMPVPVDIMMDIYTPDGDTETNRPLIKVFHSGKLLPPIINGQINGLKTDPYIVDMVERLVRRGYVVASVGYRLGWNPISPDQYVRAGTLVNAVYRGVQDSHTATRFFRKSVAEGNPYGINPDQIVNWGVGAGAYIILGAATINEYDDLVQPKFINSMQIPMVQENIHGDPFGEKMAVINIPNHTGFSNDFNLSVNMGGAILDTTWMDAGDTPIMSFAVPTDPFDPYETDFLITPTSGDLILEVSGSYDIQRKATEFGINSPYTTGTLYDDAWTSSANKNNDENEGLYPLLRPALDTDGDPNTHEPAEGAPWDWWDEAFWSQLQPQYCADAMIPLSECNWDLISRTNNLDASFEKGTRYMDSIINFYAPRACATLNLPCATIDNVTDILDDSVLTLVPNPASTSVNLSAYGKIIKSIAIFGLDGRLYNQITNINAENATIQRNNLPTGIYFVKAYFDEGIAIKKVTFE